MGVEHQKVVFGTKIEVFHRLSWGGWATLYLFGVLKIVHQEWGKSQESCFGAMNKRNALKWEDLPLQRTHKMIKQLYSRTRLPLLALIDVGDDFLRNVLKRGLQADIFSSCSFFRITSNC